MHVKAKSSNVPSGEKPVEWILYTFHEIEPAQGAMQIVKYYTMRWIIEDLFRTVKSEDVRYENSELESGATLRELVYGGDTDTAVTSGACG